VSRQVLTEQASAPPALEAWVGLLRAHAAATRALSAGLLAEHGLSINDYEALLQLSNNPDGMRRVDLAEKLLLTASGVTRMLDGLEEAGLVTKRSCETDARVTYAVLTDAGRERFEAAKCTHVDGIRGLFEDRLSEAEVRTLADLLGRLPTVGGYCELDPTAA
jgi:DNA-binding MarR family transcriptional regulator